MSYEVEVGFAGRLWKLVADAQIGNGNGSADKVELALTQAGSISVDMLHDSHLRVLVREIASRFAGGHSVNADIMGPVLERSGVPQEKIVDALDSAFTFTDIDGFRTQILRDWQRENFRALCTKAIEYVGNGKGRDGGKRVAEELSARLMKLYLDPRTTGQPMTLKGILADELQGMEAGSERGVAYPWPKLDKPCGPIVPGEVVGISAYSNGGKSVLAANLLNHWGRRGYPVIAYPTEMRARWVSRCLAAEAQIPQWVAEKRQWGRATELDKQAYRDAVQRMKGWPVDVVNLPNVTPSQIMSSARIIAKRWTQPPLIIVDHMHRLDYGGEDPEKLIGHWTKTLKNFAGDEGFMLVLLFQPRKPFKHIYQPVAGYEMRGHSAVWNEIDTHLSPYRAWVKCAEGGKVRVDVKGRVEFTRPNTKEGKLSDEYMFMKVDKRRVGGEGPTLWLDFLAESGTITERIEESYGAQH